MALTGSLVDFSVFDILQLIRLQRKDGALTLHTHRRRTCVWFSGGNVVMAERAEHPLAEAVAAALVAAGRLPEKAARNAVDKARKKPLDDVLGADLGAEAARLAEDYARATVEALFAWTDGEYAFDMDAPAANHLARPFPPIDTDQLLMDCAAASADWPALREQVAGLDTVFVRGVGDGAEPSEPEAAVLALVDGRRDVQGIADAAGGGLFDVCARLAALAERGAIEARRSAARREQPTVRGKSAARPGRALAAAGVTVLCVGLIGLCAWLALNVPKRDGVVGRGFMEATWSYRDHKARQALDLYHMLYGAYPDSLAKLVETGLVANVRAFAGMAYSREGDGYTLHAGRGDV